jgi:nitrate reductase delta subunit
LNKSANIGFRRRPPGHAAAAEEVRGWTRERFGLPADVTVMVAEVTCAVPGCPPLESVVAFWIDGARHHFKVFKPLEEVAADDLPPAFLKNALADIEGIGCECC